MTATELDGTATTLAPLPDPRTIYERMVAIISELPAIGKTQKNQQQNFMFRGHDDVMNALNPLLAKHGVFIVPDVIERVTGERMTSNNKTMYEVNLHVAFTFYGAGGDWFRCSGWGEGTDMGDKATSKAMTMAFKYVVAQAFALATAEVSDADATSPEDTTRGGSREQRPQNEPRQKQQFDPAKHMLDGAIAVHTEDDANAVRLGQRDLAPDQDWPSIEDYLCAELFDKPYAELEGAQKREFWTRLANAVVKAQDLAGGGDFPPPSLEQVKEAYAWAFNGTVLALAEPVAAEAASE